MDELYEREKEEQIEEVRELINEIISERGSAKACKEIINVINLIGKRPMYYERDDELSIYGEEEEPLYVMLNQRDLPSELVVNAIGEDEEILESLAISIDEDINFEYEEDSLVDLKGKMIALSNAALLGGVLDNYIKVQDLPITPSNALKEVVSQKIEEMDYIELYTFLSEFEAKRTILDDPFYSECIKNHIKNMSRGELAHFIQERYMFRMDVSVELVKCVLSYSSQYLESVLNKSRGTDIYGKEELYKEHNAYTLQLLSVLKENAIANAMVSDKCKENSENPWGLYLDEAIAEQEEYKQYLRILGDLNYTEFIVYMFFDFKPEDKDLYDGERKIINEQLKKLSDVDLLALVQRLGRTVNIYDVHTNDKNLVLKEAKDRGFFDENYHPKYSEEEYKKARAKYIQILGSRDGRKLRRRKTKDEEVDEYELYSEYGGDRSLIQLSKILKTAKEKIKVYESLDRLSKIEDKKQLVAMINSFNSMDNELEVVGEREYAEFFSNTIYSLPGIYSTLFINGNNRQVNNAMDLKVDEFRLEVERFREKRSRRGSENPKINSSNSSSSAPDNDEIEK